MKKLYQIIVIIFATISILAIASYASAAITWYLAEGCTRGFDEWVLVQNPRTTATNIILTFMTPDGSTTYEDPVALGANTRRTYKVNDHVPNSDVSTKVESTNGVGVIAERAMYWYDPTGTYWQEGHDAAGVTAAATTWYLAEGCTRGFDEWVLVQNPSSTTANIKLTFMTTDGSTVYEDPVALGANTRRTYKVNDHVPNSDVSTKVESTNGVGIIAERAMYWYDPTGTYWQGGHDAEGATSTATTWYLAEGCTRGFDEWVLVQNPSSTTANIKLTFMTTDGSTVYEDPVALGANTRRTYKVNDHVSNSDVSTKVESTNGVGVIAERAMYWYDPTGTYWQGGHCSKGVLEETHTFYTTTGNASVNVDGNVYEDGDVCYWELIWVQMIINPSRGVLGFDISSIHGRAIVSATLRVYLTEYEGALNNVVVDHINFGSSITADDYSGGTLTSNIGTICANSTVEWKELDVTSYVQADLDAGRTSSQYRFKFTSSDQSFAPFEDAENSGHTGNRPELVVTYQ